MATLVASQSSSQGNPLEFNSNDTSNLFFGTSSADYLNFSGKGKLTVLDVSNGDVFSFENMASTGFKARIAGNTVFLLNGSNTEVAKLGGLVSGESIKVQFSDGNFMTLAGESDGTKIYSGGSSLKTLTSTSATLGSSSSDLNSLKLTEADITTTVSSSTVTVLIDKNSQTFSATVNFSLFGGGTSVAATDGTGGNAGKLVATYTYTTLPVIIGGVNGTDVNLVDTSSGDLSDYIAVTATKGTGTYADSVTVDNIAPVLNESLITTTAPAAGVSGTITVSVAKLDQLGTLISGVTVDFSEFGGPSEVVAELSGDFYVATATGTATTGESDQAIVTAVDIVGNVTTFIDVAPVA